jgi:hypothetical protein
LWRYVPSGASDGIPRSVATFDQNLGGPVEGDDLYVVVAGDRKEAGAIGGVVAVSWLLIELNVQQQDVLEPRAAPTETRETETPVA